MKLTWPLEVLDESLRDYVLGTPDQEAKHCFICFSLGADIVRPKDWAENYRVHNG